MQQPASSCSSSQHVLKLISDNNKSGAFLGYMIPKWSLDVSCVCGCRSYTSTCSSTAHIWRRHLLSTSLLHTSKATRTALHQYEVTNCTSSIRLTSSIRTAYTSNLTNRSSNRVQTNTAYKQSNKNCTSSIRTALHQY